MARIGAAPAAVGAMMVSVLSSVRVATSVLLSTRVVLISLPLRVIGNTLDLMLVMVVTVVLVWVMYWVAGTGGLG